MALDGESLYVADTDNHTIRLVDLARGTVETVAGTGQQARGYSQNGNALSMELSSPWDLTLHDGTLYIAMAGVHQLWALHLKEREVRPYAGNGREAPDDGPLLTASLDQPSGITSDGNRLYFADSEASAVRYADLDPNGRVGTIVGQNLFVFGDVNGIGDDVRLQHVQGVTYHDGVLYIADTYNNKVKKVFPNTRSVLSFLGSGQPGHQDGPRLRGPVPRAQRRQRGRRQALHRRHQQPRHPRRRPGVRGREHAGAEGALGSEDAVHRSIPKEGPLVRRLCGGDPGGQHSRAHTS